VTLPPKLIQLEERFLSPELVETKARALINLELCLKRPDPNSAVIPVVLAQRPPVSYGIKSAQLGSGNDLDFSFQPGERVPIDVTLELNPDEPVGSVQTFDIVQTDPNGDAVGGARIVTVITPD
jgi:hypothetical protein